MGIFGVILALVAVLFALLATFMFGTVGGIVAGVVALVAVALGLLKRKKDGKGGIAAIAIGALAIILAFSMTSTWSNAFSDMHKKAAELMPDSLWASITGNNYSGGLFGILKNIPNDQASMDKLVNELNELNKLVDAQKK